jgi:hypothetical protein
MKMEQIMEMLKSMQEKAEADRKEMRASQEQMMTDRKTYQVMLARIDANQQKIKKEM